MHFPLAQVECPRYKGDIETGSNEMSRLQINATISARILAYMVNGGMTLQQAFDKVLGPAQYECLALELYEALGGAET